MSTKLNDHFNVIEVEYETSDSPLELYQEISPPAHRSIDENMDDDYEASRANLHALLQQGQDALTSALALAKQAEHPRAFEVVGNLIKQLSDVNHQLLDLTTKHQNQKGLAQKEAGPDTVNNTAVFIGTGADLNKFLKDKIK